MLLTVWCYRKGKFCKKENLSLWHVRGQTGRCPGGFISEKDSGTFWIINGKGTGGITQILIERWVDKDFGIEWKCGRIVLIKLLTCRLAELKELPTSKDSCNFKTSIRPNNAWFFQKWTRPHSVTFKLRKLHVIGNAKASYWGMDCSNCVQQYWKQSESNWNPQCWKIRRL